MIAHIIPNTVQVIELQTLPNGVKVLITMGGNSYETYKNAPNQLSCENIKYGKSSFNSDNNTIIYRNDKLIATF
jgi:hypothetical protein